MATKVERPQLVLDFSEALKDSPAFRQDLHDHYEYFSKLHKNFENVCFFLRNRLKLIIYAFLLKHFFIINF